jgi:hypothetical protein
MASMLKLTKDEGHNIVNGDIFRWSWMCRRIAEWFGVEWVMAADEMAPLGNADGKGRRARYGRGWRTSMVLWNRPLAPGLAPAHGSRLEPADRSDDGHGAQPGAGLSCIPEHGGPFLDLFSGLRADGIIP